MQGTTKAERRALHRAEEAERQGSCELGRPGPPQEEPQPVWGRRPASSRAVFIVTLVGRVDLYCVPRKFPLDAYLVGISGEDERAEETRPAHLAADMRDPIWHLGLFYAMRRGLIAPWEIGPLRCEHERQHMIDEQPERYFRIPNNKHTRWDPEVHGVEAEVDGDDVVVGWRPGVYTFSAHSGADGNWTLRIPGERGSVPAREPAQDVLRGMHALISEMEDRLC